MFSSTLTILVIGAFLCIIMLLVLSSLWRTAIPGVREWTAGNALAVAAFFLYAFGKSLPPLAAYELANAVNAAASAALLLGFRRFLGRSAPLPLLAAGVALLTAAIAVFHYWIDSFALRTLAVALYQGIVFGAIALAVLKSGKTALLRYPVLFTGAMAITVAGGHLIRGVLYVAGPEIPVSLLQPSAWNLLFLSASTLVMPVMTLGGVMMVHDAMMQKSEYAANRDFLTGAWSRRAFFEHAQHELARARRLGSNIALLLIDVDHFKQVNDRFGHATGDRVLIDIVRKSEALLRNIDYLGRIGGEEFAVLLSNADREAALAVAERLRQTLQAAPQADGADNAYTVSIGVAILRESESFESLMQRADAALYRSKAAGRNQVSIGIVDATPGHVPLDV